MSTALTAAASPRPPFAGFHTPEIARFGRSGEETALAELCQSYAAEARKVAWRNGWTKGKKKPGRRAA